MTASERLSLARHEAWISQPVKVLFPFTGKKVPSRCRACGQWYERAAHAGKSRGFCDDRCRDAFVNGRRPPP